MRRLILSLAILGFAPSAFAADYSEPYLRGSQVYEPGTPIYYDWSGSYIGGQVGYSSAHTEFSNAWGSLVPLAVAGTVLDGAVASLEPFGSASGSAASYGAFIGFNSQWDDVVIGLEANYSHTSARSSIFATRTDPVGPDSLVVAASRETHVTDFGTLRGRAGYVMGRFLPYAMIGLAIGRIEENRSASVTPVVGGVALTPFFASSSDSKWTYGYAAGVGLDVMFSHNMFLRAEYEFVQFVDHVNTSINTVRAGLGFRF